MTHISLSLQSDPFHLHALIFYCALHAVLWRMNKICLKQNIALLIAYLYM